ncbi:MAG TPA: hypothetical protein DEF27_10605, partial [Oscillatoriales bacterium UBA8482]|nr:hypothetical protein [Oscillatoriales bacterium UBA8482]
MNHDPLIESVEITINPIKQSSINQPQSLDDFLDQTLIKFIDPFPFDSISHSPEIPDALVEA